MSRFLCVAALLLGLFKVGEGLSHESSQPVKNIRVSNPPHSEPMSLNFSDIPVRQILQLLAEYRQINMVVSDAVTGNLTLHLDSVHWQQALDIVLEAKGLRQMHLGNVVFIAPEAEIEQRLLMEKTRKNPREAVPVTKRMEIKFADAADIAAVIESSRSSGILSPSGIVNSDPRTNALIIYDFPAMIGRVESMVELLDIPAKQVQIEARIVSVNEGHLDELGIRWGYYARSGGIASGGSVEALSGASGIYQPDGGNDNIGQFLNVNLAATSLNAPRMAFQIARLNKGMLLDLELSALETESKAEIISSPRLITTNKQPAFIEQGTEIPYLESSSSGVTSVSFKKAVLSLKVTPQITPDNQLLLDLNVSQDQPGDVVKTGTGEAVAIHTQRIGTQVLVNNGETIVLGGIVQHRFIQKTEKVPMLGDLPLLGALFRRNLEQSGRSEMLIFVMPKIVMQ